MPDLEGLDKGPQQDSYGVTLSQQLDQSGCSEQLQETHVDGIQRLDRQRERETEGREYSWV